MQYALPQQPDSGSTIHPAFPHLETINLSLHWPRAPRQGDACFHLLSIRPSSSRVTLERLEVAGRDTLQPALTLFRLTLTHDAGKVLRQRDGFGDGALLGSEPSALLLFFIVERGLPLHHHPRGSTRCQRLVHRNDRHRESQRCLETRP